MNKTNQPNQRSEPREHLFSPETDLCVYCGKSAQDDAVENTPYGSDQQPPCQPCNGKGWLLAKDVEHGS